MAIPAADDNISIKFVIRSSYHFKQY